MIYTCKKCLKIFEKEIDKCPSCGGEIKQKLNKEYLKEKRIDYECPHCRHNFNFNFSICPSCGKRSNRCPSCGYITDRNVKICTGCGHLSNDPIEPPALACCPDNHYLPIKRYWALSCFPSNEYKRIK